MLIGDTIKVFPANYESFISFDHNDYEQICQSIPFSSIGWAIKGDFFEELMQVFNLWRLNKVKQLAFLRNPIIRENNPNIISLDFPHTRFDHSLDVGVLMGISIQNISRQKDQPPMFDLLKTALTAGFLHDLLTPAGGDTMKTVSDEDFDEDMHFNEMFQKPECKAFFKRHHIDENLLYDTILNKGVLGKLLNYADKIAYTSRDTYHFLNMIRIQEMGNTVDRSEGFHKIAALVAENPLITSIWSNIVLRKGIPCFSGKGIIKKVADFMKLRALMFRHLYYHPQAQFPERALAWFVMKQIYNNGVTREDLLREGDQWLERKIDEYTGIPFFASRCLNMVHPKLDTFETQAQAHTFMREMHGSKKHMYFYEEFKSRTKNGIEDFHISYNRKIADLFTLDPVNAEVIKDIMTFPEVHRVYSFNLEPLGEEFSAKFLELQEKYHY